jgi:hypothetical protein
VEFRIAAAEPEHLAFGQFSVMQRAKAHNLHTRIASSSMLSG